MTHHEFQLYNDDCLNVLPSIQADIIITDPPYADRTHKGAMTNRTELSNGDYRQGGRKLVNFECITDAQFILIAKACLKVARRWVVMTCDHRHAALTFDWPEFIRLGAWVKGAPMPQITGDRPGSGHESVLVLHNPGKKRWNGGGRAAVYHATVLKDPSVVIQPTQKPVELISQFVRDFSEEGETVCDPFMGSATTGIACLNLRRKFIGIEQNEERFQGAQQRLEQHASQALLI